MRSRRPEPASAQDGKWRHERALRGRVPALIPKLGQLCATHCTKLGFKSRALSPTVNPRGAALHGFCNIWASLLGAVQACTQQPVSQPSVLNEGVSHGVGGRQDKQPSLSTVRSAQLGTGAAEVMGTSADGTGFSLGRSVILAPKKMNYCMTWEFSHLFNLLEPTVTG